MSMNVWILIREKSIKAFRFYEIFNFLKNSRFYYILRNIR